MIDEARYLESDDVPAGGPQAEPADPDGWRASPSTHELAAALAKAQGLMTGAGKSTENPFFRSKYADLASVWDACRGPLSQCQLAIVQCPQVTYLGSPEFYETVTKQGDKRLSVKVLCRVSVRTRLLHASGQWIEDTLSTVLPVAEPQAIGSAITYLRRYALQALVGVAPEDDDGETAQGRGVTPSATAARPPAWLSAPAGYDEWLIDLTACAEEGEARLRAAWGASKLEYRKHLTTTDPARQAALKARAAFVGTDAADFTQPSRAEPR